MFDLHISEEYQHLKWYVCTKHKQTHDIQQLCMPVECCLPTFPRKCALLFSPNQLIYIHMSVQRYIFFAFKRRYCWQMTYLVALVFSDTFLLLKLWPQLLSDCLEWQGCVLNVKVVRCVLCVTQPPEFKVDWWSLLQWHAYLKSVAGITVSECWLNNNWHPSVLSSLCQIQSHYRHNRS